MEVTDLGDMHDGAFLIDESHLKLSSRRWYNLSEDIETYFTLSRHIDVDVIIACLDFSFVDKFVRTIIDRVYMLHRFGPITWWSVWDPRDLDAEGRRRSGGMRWPCGFGAFVHTKKLHSMYDDKALFGSLLEQREPRNWIENGIDTKVPDSLRIRKLKDADGERGNDSGRRRQREA